MVSRQTGSMASASLQKPTSPPTLLSHPSPTSSGSVKLYVPELRLEDMRRSNCFFSFSRTCRSDCASRASTRRFLSAMSLRIFSVKLLKWPTLID